jgi:flagellar biosynthesis/type III secretory pathway M-ring protein FliF/YscJ
MPELEGFIPGDNPQVNEVRMDQNNQRVTGQVTVTNSQQMDKTENYTTQFLSLPAILAISIVGGLLLIGIIVYIIIKRRQRAKMAAEARAKLPVVRAVVVHQPMDKELPAPVDNIDDDKRLYDETITIPWVT